MVKMYEVNNSDLKDTGIASLNKHSMKKSDESRIQNVDTDKYNKGMTGGRTERETDGWNEGRADEKTYPRLLQLQALSLDLA